MGEGVLCSVMVRIVVGVDGLRLQPGDGIKLFYGRGSQARQGPEHCTLNFCNFCILNSIHKGVLSLCRMILQLLGSVLLPERGNLVEIHLEIVSHLLREVILGSFASSAHQACRKARADCDEEQRPHVRHCGLR